MYINLIYSPTHHRNYIFIRLTHCTQKLTQNHKSEPILTGKIIVRVLYFSFFSLFAMKPKHNFKQDDWIFLTDMHSDF